MNENNACAPILNEVISIEETPPPVLESVEYIETDTPPVLVDITHIPCSEESNA